MTNLANIFMWIDLIVGGVAVTSLIIALSLNVMVYFYQSAVGFKKFHEILRDYRERKSRGEIKQ